MRQGKTFLIAFLIYLSLGAIIFPFIRWYADNPDTFQYLSIAGKYLSGDFSHAINTYWSPMISWLLVIPLLIFNDELTAFKFLQFLIGVFTLYHWTSLQFKTSLRNKLKTTLVFISIPFLLSYSLLNPTPDLLFMGMLIYILNILLSGNFLSNRSSGIQLALAGAILFLTKAFGFPFFICLIFFAIFINTKFKTPSKEGVKNISVLFCLFLLICSAWIIPLSIHAKHFTISEAPKFNLSVDAAPLPGRSAELPIISSGLINPLPNTTCAWETPGDFVSVEMISPLSSPTKYFQIVKRNILSIYYFDFSHQVGIIFLILLICFLLLKGLNKLFSERWVVLIIGFIFLFYAGYSLILVHARYTWINNLLMILMSFFFISEIFGDKKFKTVFIILTLVIAGLGIKRPAKEILFTNDSDFPLGWYVKSFKHPFETMWIFYRQDQQLKHVLDDVAINRIIHGNFASLKENHLERDSYTSSLRIARAAKSVYYGQITDNLEYQSQKEELEKHNIDFFITWKNTSWGNDIPVYANEFSGVKIYSLK